MLEAINRATIRDFHRVPHTVYAHMPPWISPLEAETEGIFSPAKTPFFSHGEAVRWVLYDTTGAPIGRIAAFVNREKILSGGLRIGGCGFFECPENEAAATYLFDTARTWLLDRGVEAMDGPINFGENDRFWGLLVEGFEQAPFVGMPYHPPYYERLFRAYGFETYYEQFSYNLDLTRALDPRMEAVAARALARPHISIQYATRHKLAAFLAHVKTIYNDAWQHHENFTPITDAQLQAMANEMRHILIDTLMPFVFVGGEPAGFIIALPDLNQVFRPLKGKFPLWKQLVFLWRSRNQMAWYRNKGIITRGRGIIAGIRPQYRRLGLDAAMISATADATRALGIQAIDISWIGSFNPKMRSFSEAICGPPVRKHATLRYVFDRTKPFVPAPAIG